jgi:murein peptide amidase A
MLNLSPCVELIGIGGRGKRWTRRGCEAAVARRVASGTVATVWRDASPGLHLQLVRQGEKVYGAIMDPRGDSIYKFDAMPELGNGPARLGKNQGAYFGESIDIESVLNDDLEAARIHGWEVESLVPEAKLPVLAFTRRAQESRKKLYFSTGIHGDEPAGPLAIRQLLKENHWPPDVDLWVMPCLNPEGFILRQRTNGEGIDLNRDYRGQRSHTVRAHIRWLEHQPRFDVAVCLHEDWEAHGFYLYELNPDREPSLAERMISAVSKCCPIDISSTIDGWSAAGGIIRPKIEPADRPEWPEALHLVTHRTRHSYTLEAPSDFGLSIRIKASVTAIQELLSSQQIDDKE